MTPLQRACWTLLMIPLVAVAASIVTIAAAAICGIAITACPTGIAHTYMAADALKLAAERAGVQLTVETQGSSGSTPLEASTIAAADAVIFATDVGVKDRQRFAGKPVIASGVILSAAGEAIAFIPNAVGRALLYNERMM